MTSQRLSHLFLTAFLCGATALPLMAQTVPTTPADTPMRAETTVDCPSAASMAEPATQEAATADGTAPSNSGSTGWSGGTGGSHIGTNPSGAVMHTKTWHAPTARGLDLKGRPEPVPAC
ncbi:hypothetical protein RGQ15_03730 [Paracoccus sp. MBLB3053]|uniref:Uncharacterized protein n=1 Tax=Paracoccus aurantius TaxID=3073814 RepID=A0ABU2HNS8_9RHOB|nr:hypothetical protein [Paracoccus sp. MBLB3053]MDS9466691.1 hypothetical protein [Paracoccus sp. MBLB3053]